MRCRWGDLKGGENVVDKLPDRRRNPPRLAPIGQTDFFDQTSK